MHDQIIGIQPVHERRVGRGAVTRPGCCPSPCSGPSASVIAPERLQVTLGIQERFLQFRKSERRARHRGSSRGARRTACSAWFAACMLSLCSHLRLPLDTRRPAARSQTHGASACTCMYKSQTSAAGDHVGGLRCHDASTAPQAQCKQLELSNASNLIHNPMTRWRCLQIAVEARQAPEEVHPWDAMCQHAPC